MSNITPFVKRMRATGGTIYVFSSATEDIGLNISERNNVVKISDYALLDIPPITAPDTTVQNTFNTLGINGAFKSFLDSNSIKDGRVLVAESFQNYALNLETNLIQRNEYNAKLSATVSERVFWKWLKETGAIRWQSIDTSIGTYWQEEIDTDSSTGYNSVVKCIGEITAGSIRTDTFGTYNETYVLVPSSYGQSEVFFKQYEDDNYKHGLVIQGGTNIYGRDNYTSPHPDALDYTAYYDISDSETVLGAYDLQYDASNGNWMAGWWQTAEGIPFSDNAYYTDSNSYLSTGKLYTDIRYHNGGSDIQFRRSNVDCMTLEFDLNSLRGIYSDQSITFDKMAIDNAIDDSFYFNAVMIYYSVWNTAQDKLLARNLLGVLFLDSPVGNTSNFPASNIIIPSIQKIQSNLTGFGTSYSFRINVKTDNLFDDTQSIIYDESSSTRTILSDFSEVFDSLGKSVDILNKHTSTINYISGQYINVNKTIGSIMSAITDLEYSINGISRNITGGSDVIPVFSTGLNPLVDSSMYFYNGNFGIHTDRPKYELDVDGCIGAYNIILGRNIKDTVGNVLLGPDSLLSYAPFVREASLGTDFYWDNGVLTVDANPSGITQSTIDVIDASLAWLSANKTSQSYVDSHDAMYVKSASTGFGLLWNGGVLDVSISIPGIDASYASVDYVNASLLAKADIDSPLFTGDPTRVTDISTYISDNTLATAKFVHLLIDSSLSWLDANKAEITYLDSSLALKANVDSPLFTGDPARDTDVSIGDRSSILATTNFVMNTMDSSMAQVMSYVDGSLLSVESDVSALQNLTEDLSTYVHSEYLVTSDIVVVPNSSTYIPVGLKDTDRSVILTYTTSRSTVFREGEIRILNDGANLFFTENYQENSSVPYSNNSGITMDVTFDLVDPTKIDLHIITNGADASSLTFRYSKKLIKS